MYQKHEKLDTLVRALVTETLKNDLVHECQLIGIPYGQKIREWSETFVRQQQDKRKCPQGKWSEHSHKPAVFPSRASRGRMQMRQ